MTELSDAPWNKIRQLFPAEHQPKVATILQNECGNNLPFLENLDKDGLDRIRFAALKLSNGSLKKLQEAVDLAKSDWRDLLVAAGVAHSVDAHKQWKISKAPSRPPR
jgi:hypothetical protein